MVHFTSPVLKTNNTQTMRLFQLRIRWIFTQYEVEREDIGTLYCLLVISSLTRTEHFRGVYTLLFSNFLSTNYTVLLLYMSCLVLIHSVSFPELFNIVTFPGIIVRRRILLLFELTYITLH